tara:strand:- start:33 stop:2156 length:2124 start_codon:yes stop_codon:yes gene_type:complete
MKTFIKIFVLVVIGYSQHVNLYLDQVVYTDSNNVDIYINMDSDAPIASFNFTLNGFDNVVSTNSISPQSLSFQYLESLSFVEGYFSGGDTNNDPIPTGGGPFLTVSINYDSVHLNGQYLTIEDVSPGSNSQVTHFYTYDENGDLAEMTYDWSPMTWILGTEDIFEWVGQDCSGNIWGQAFEDDCGVCSEGSTNHESNSDKDCAGECFGDAQILSYYRDYDGDGLIGDSLVECDNSPICNSGGLVPMYYSEEFDEYFDCILADSSYDSEPYCPNTCNEGNQSFGTGSDSCLDDCGVCLGINLDQDCNGVCFGDSSIAQWYPDCDIDGLADNTNFIEECGYPEQSDVASVCGFIPNCSDDQNILCGLISIDPNNHSFDSHPDCTSNSVDLCGVCDGFNQYRDCQNQCAEWAPICSDPSYSGYQGEIACDGYIGLGSGFEFDYNNGIDDCGVCGGDNSDCTGCTDSNATNYCAECTIYDGSCTFELWAGDVNRDGMVNADDIDGLGIFWHQDGSPRDHQSIDWYMQYATDDWGDICAAYADTNGDGYIDHLDLSAILYNWGNTVNYTFSSEPSICYDIEDAGNYRQNFEEILNVLQNQDYDSPIVRDMIAYLLELLNLEFSPNTFSLYQNYPNPFNPLTTINFDVSSSTDVQIIIYDVKGNLIFEYDFGYLSPGLYSYNWDASNLTSGMYIYSLYTSEGFKDQKQMMLIK